MSATQPIAATDPRLRDSDGPVSGSPAAASHLAEAMPRAREATPSGGAIAGRALLALLRQG